jgi:transcriptional regulator with XRE-family HTH domain
MEKLKILRKSLCLTQQQVAMNLGIVQQKYQQYESGKYQPDFETLIRIADYFGVTLDYLLGRTEERTTAKTPSFTVIEHRTDFELSKDEKALIITLRRSNNSTPFIRAMLTMLGEDRTIEEILKMA